ncbi:MAG: hypothetical protein OEY89_18900 [Gammaproteobacteria bacterium]|nr:hypothetical protein [Gammaproteobacteria bacterium]
MNKYIYALAMTSVMLIAGCSSSFSEDTLHQMLDEADELAKECAVYEREVACNKTVNKLTRLIEYINNNESESTAHFKSHPFDLQKLKTIQASTGKVSRGY